MRLICGVVGTVAAAALAASAHALDLPPLPPLPLPPPPTISLPTVPAPTVPAPTVPAPTTPTQTPTVPAPPGPSPPAAPPPAAQPPATTAAAPQGSGAVAPTRTASSRHARRRPRVVTYFRLEHARRIVVAVRELAPICRSLGTYRLEARKGRNALNLPARVKRPGSYQFVGRAHGRRVFSVEARVARGRRVVLDAATTSVCPAVPVLLAAAVSAQQPQQLHVKSASVRSSALPRVRSPLVGAVTLKDAPASIRPLLFALLGLAILLFATAATPRQLLPAGRAAAVIATRRAHLAAAGIALVVVVAVVTAVS